MKHCRVPAHSGNLAVEQGKASGSISEVGDICAGTHFSSISKYLLDLARGNPRRQGAGPHLSWRLISDAEETAGAHPLQKVDLVQIS